ncbi:MAG: hypothetical protein ACI4IS_01035 [Acutalibacteraceae bacterium]
MNTGEIVYKIRKRLQSRFVLSLYSEENYENYCRKYASYRHMKNSSNLSQGGFCDVYMAARPNPGAGIGHQMANWIAGYWYAKLFGLKFAHIPFSKISAPFIADEWDAFLGFGNGEESAEDLVSRGWKKVILPRFDEYSDKQVSVIQKIIDSYKGEKVILILEQDQFYHDQYGVMNDIKRKFYDVHKNDRLQYSKDEFNIAVHVRRGDIVQNKGENNPNLSMRWLDNDYFVNALKSTLELISTDKKVHIYLFSQGDAKDYSEFDEFSNITFCLDMDAKASFLHMVYADALITSKSSFSYKPALLCEGLKICPKNFWHGYPKASDWILLDDEGKII